MTRQPRPPPTASQLTRRQFLCMPIIILLYTAAVPFTPVAWLVNGVEGAYLVDRFVAGIVLLCGCYFQWKISGIAYPTFITISNPLAQDSSNYIRNGRVGATPTAATTMYEFIYHPGDYLLYTGGEVLVLLFAEFAGFELLRRVIVCGVLGGLWVVGWSITPRSTKEWAWSHIKALWFWIVLDVLRDSMFGGGRRRR
ncbi:unnamed protein product [Periconia digitata]|uniref:Uncharacterized protein n=1 Tax=Periconia digitata TaxID=1303443 RepID=A0A9W4U6J6_9PLEO|nr:unnamed protein product [Periconia digitata]